MNYPVWDLAMGGGLLMALVAIPHVIVSHFAIGGGLVLAVTETLGARRNDAALLALARKGSLALILISTVFGAISGVGIWVVAGLISPGAISTLIRTYVWGWAIEWTFFIVELVAALVYFATWDRVSRKTHVAIAWIYFVAAYLSLVVINGIVTFMLTPGKWLETGAFWDGFLNPTYGPSLVLRTGVCALMAAVFLLFLVRRAGGDRWPFLARYLAVWLAGGALLSFAGYLWWEASLPQPILALFRGDLPVLPALAATRSLALGGLAAAFLLGGTLLALFPRAWSPAVAVAVAAAAFTFFGGYERVREGARKPFLIHGHTYSNGVRVAEVAEVDARGWGSVSGWVALRAREGPEAHGRAVFLAQCASCHTVDGYQGIRRILPTVADVVALASDPGEDAFRAECARCHAGSDGAALRAALPGPDEIRQDPDSIRQLNGMMVAAALDGFRTAAPDRPMPPVAGSAEDLEALAAYLASLERPEPAPESPVAGAGGE